MIILIAINAACAGAMASDLTLGLLAGNPTAWFMLALAGLVKAIDMLLDIVLSQ